MFFANQSKFQQERYILLLCIMSSLSKLFSEKQDEPYLHYRAVENIFCKAFERAQNLARSDISFDVKVGNIGIGLKTFLNRNGNCLEKIAEFNKDRSLYIKEIEQEEVLIQHIASLRNERIKASCGVASVSLDTMYYHCVSRAKSRLYLHEEPMRLINLEEIKINQEKNRNNTIFFTDSLEEYAFNLSKSTLYKRFNVKIKKEIPIKIFEDPFEILERYFSGEFKTDISNKIIDRVILPLYSYNKLTKKPEIFTRSGLNQWNANGRKRHPNEIYIPIPVEIRKRKYSFFPMRDTKFTLRLPDGTFKMAKVCQSDGKALMTDPNKDLGGWLLRKVLQVDEYELVNYDKLVQIGIDSVEILKYSDHSYEIAFKKLGSYEEYIEELDNLN